MFLWLTSPAPAEYEGGSHVFNSPVFYEVSAQNERERRTLKQIPKGTDQAAYAKEHPLEVKVVQKDPDAEASIVDSAGQIHPIRRPKWVRLESRELIQIFRTQIAPDGQPQFFDLKDVLIGLLRGLADKQALLDRNQRPIVITGEMTAANGRRYPTDADGNFA
jgi:hypothetical protein